MCAIFTRRRQDPKIRTLNQVQTAVVAKTLAPTWDEAFEFKVPRHANSSQIRQSSLGLRHFYGESLEHHSSRSLLA